MKGNAAMRGVPIAALAFLAGAASPVSTTTYYVAPDGSGDFPTIQAAVDAAGNGDEVVLSAGTFLGDGNRGVMVLGKALSIRSQSGVPAMCVVDCEGQARGFFFQSISQGPCSLDGITVTNGGSDLADLGAAVACWWASPLIRNCIFRTNTAWQGGAIYAQSSSPEIVGCLFVGNRATIGPGGALDFGPSASPTIRTCTIVQNEAMAGVGGAIGCSFSATVIVQHSIISGNVGTNPVHCSLSAIVTLSCSDVFGNIGGDWIDCLAGQENLSGNFGADALFCDPGAGYFELRADSPCAPPGLTGCGLVGALPVGCDVVSVTGQTWGEIKASYR